MKKIFALIIVMAGMSSCIINVNGINGDGNKTVRCSGEVIEKDMQLSGFDRIEVQGSADAEFFQGDEFKVVVTANEEVFEHLDYKVEDGILILSTVDHVNIMAKEYNVSITAPVLKDMTVKGAADFDMNGYRSDEGLSIDVMGAGDISIENITVPTLSVEIKGAGDLDVDDMNVGELVIDVKGAGDVTVSGKATKARFEVSGAGEIDARGLKCDDVKTSKNGFAAIKR